MSVWLTKRLVYALVTLLAISTIVFGLVRLTGDPVLLFLPQDASAEDVARMRHQLGFTDPLPVQYLRFLVATLRGDLGFSLKHQEPALHVVVRRVPATFELDTAFMLLVLVIVVLV